ncbi:MAG: family 78 glycoside hydrolase catalytic domain [Clostridia bacterium]|nr:family 78 glycoside hydrolase catalytic domain [Clostridia bacterium]
MFEKAKAIFLKDKSKTPNTFALFWKKAEMKRGPVNIKITASSFYRLYVNGRFISHGPARSGRGCARVDEYWTDDIIDGENLFEIEAACYYNAFGTVNDNTNDPGFVIFEASDAASGDVGLYTDESWEGVLIEQRDRYAQRHSHCRQVTEVWDLTRSNTPHEVGEAEAPKFIPRAVPYPGFERIHAKSLLDVCAYEYDESVKVAPKFYDLWNEEYQSKGEYVGRQDMTLRRVPLGCSVRREGGSVSFGADKNIKCAAYDMKEMHVGFIDFAVKLEESAQVDVIYSERLEDDGEIISQAGFNTCFRVYCDKGVTRFTSFEPYAFRYVKILVNTDKPFAVLDIGLITYVTPDRRGGTFLCSDEDLNRIYDASYKTLLLNTLDIFMDCPDRERGGWLCDSLWTGRAAALMLADPSVERAMIENFLCEPAQDCYYGFFPQCYPATGDFKHGALTTWSFWFIIEIYEYYMRTGDRELIDRMKERIDGFFEGIAKLCGEHGLFESHSTVFVDWSLSNNREYVYPISCAANVEYACALECYDALYGVPEAKAHAEKIRKTLQSVAIDLGGYDPRFILHDSLEYKDGKLRGKPFYSEAAQYTMLWGELFTEKECPGLIDAVVNELGPCPDRKPPALDIGAANMFIGLCIRLDMLSKLGNTDVMMKEIRHLCGVMLREGPGTLWETVSGTSSRCHGFMAHIGVLLSRDVLGLDIPRTVPEKTVRIAPHICGLKFAKGTTDTPDGVISVNWNTDGKRFELNVTAPETYGISVKLPEQIRGFERIYLNGAPVGKDGIPAKLSSPVCIKAEK